MGMKCQRRVKSPTPTWSERICSMAEITYSSEKPSSPLKCTDGVWKLWWWQKSKQHFTYMEQSWPQEVLRAHWSTLRRLDFTTGKRWNRGELPKDRKAVALANELERTRRVREISQVTPLGWLQSRLKMGNKPTSPTCIYTSTRDTSTKIQEREMTQ